MIRKKIKGFSNYEISSCGRVFSLKRKHNQSDKMSNEEIELKIQYIDDAYAIVGLTDDDGNRRMKSVHRLVAEAFIPNPENKRTVNHKDGDKSNNSVNNLEWATHSENNKHAFDKNLKENKKTYTKKDEMEIIRLKKEGFKIKEIKEILNHIATIGIQRVCKKNNLINKKKNTSKYSIVEKILIKKMLVESSEPLSTLCPKINIERRLAGKIRRNLAWQEIEI